MPGTGFGIFPFALPRTGCGAHPKVNWAPSMDKSRPESELNAEIKNLCSFSLPTECGA
jgi:hypothetical protein